MSLLICTDNPPVTSAFSLPAPLRVDTMPMLGSSLTACAALAPAAAAPPSRCFSAVPLPALRPEQLQGPDSGTQTGGRACVP